MRRFLEDFDKDSFPFLWAKEDFYTMKLDEFFFFQFFGPLPRHMEVPRLGG